VKEEARGAPSGLGCTASAAKLSAEREEQSFSRDSLALERMFAPALGTSGRLTTELILRSPQYMNACSEYEIDLRGNKISAIENLGGTENQFDSIDLSDNEIVKLEGFPLLPKLKTLLLNNNRVMRISKNLEASIPNVETLVLTGNRLTNITVGPPPPPLRPLLSIYLPQGHRNCLFCFFLISSRCGKLGLALLLCMAERLFRTDLPACLPGCLVAWLPGCLRLSCFWTRLVLTHSFFTCTSWVFFLILFAPTP